MFCNLLKKFDFLGQIFTKTNPTNVIRFLNNSAAEGGHAGDDCSRLGLSKGKSTKIGSFSKLTGYATAIFREAETFLRLMKNSSFAYFFRKKKVLR